MQQKNHDELFEQYARYFLFKKPILIEEEKNGAPRLDLKDSTIVLRLPQKGSTLIPPEPDLFETLAEIKLSETDLRLSLPLFSSDTPRALAERFWVAIEPLRQAWIVQHIKKHLPENLWMQHKNGVYFLAKTLTEIKNSTIKKTDKAKQQEFERLILIHSASLYVYLNGELPKFLNNWFNIHQDIYQKFMLYESYLLTEPDLKHYLNIAQQFNISATLATENNIPVFKLWTA